MLTHIDWIMHAKATRSMAFRSLRHGETETAKRLFQAASGWRPSRAKPSKLLSPTLVYKSKLLSHHPENRYEPWRKP